MSSLLGMTRKYTGGGMVPPYQYRGGGAVGNTDTVPAMLTPGEVVLNSGQQQRLGAMTGVPSGALFNAAGVPGFQGGGMVPEFEVAEPVSTAHNAMDMLIMQNEMDRIAQEDIQHGAMRQYDPWSDPRSQELQNTLLEMVTGGYNPGAVVGMAEVAGRKTVSKMLKDLIFETKGAESKWGAAKKLLQEAAAPRNIGREHGIDEFKVADEMFRQKDIYNTNASLIQTLRNWQKLTKKAVKK